MLLQGKRSTWKRMIPSTSIKTEIEMKSKHLLIPFARLHRLGVRSGVCLVWRRSGIFPRVRHRHYAPCWTRQWQISRRTGLFWPHLVSDRAPSKWRKKSANKNAFLLKKNQLWFLSVPFDFRYFVYVNEKRRKKVGNFNWNQLSTVWQARWGSIHQTYGKPSVARFIFSFNSLCLSFIQSIDRSITATLIYSLYCICFPDHLFSRFAFFSDLDYHRTNLFLNIDALDFWTWE